MRVGHGYDVHRLGSDKPLKVGGVVLGDRGPISHSDGDVLFHALIDGLLGAAGLGDMGTYYPDSDPRYLGVSSALLAQQVMQKVRALLYELGNADLTVILKAPKLAPHISEMRDHLAKALAVDRRAINIKAKSANGVGAVGRGEAMEAYAVVLLENA